MIFIISKDNRLKKIKINIVCFILFNLLLLKKNIWLISNLHNDNNKNNNNNLLMIEKYLFYTFLR
jgi:hypothetical protein